MKKRSQHRVREGEETQLLASSDGGLSSSTSNSGFRLLSAELREQHVAYLFDRMRFLIDEDLSHPFARNRFDCRGMRSNDKSWDVAHLHLAEADQARRSLYGITFKDTAYLAHNQCRFRTLVAQCHAYIEDYDGAIRELRLAGSGLDERGPGERFLLGIVNGLQAQTLMMRADQSLRRVWDMEPGGAYRPRPRFDATSILIQYRRARRDLDRARFQLDAAEDCIRGIRMNVSRWEWLCELRGQLAIERILLRLVELDFDINTSKDDWRLIGEYQREVTNGLEAIRAALDSTLYTFELDSHHTFGHFVEEALKSPESDEHRISTKVRKRLLGMWMRFMIGSFWLHRLSTFSVSSVPATQSISQLSPRLQALQRFATHGSVGSFWARWVALNQAAGLERLVFQDSATWVDSLAKDQKSQHVKSVIWRGDVAKRAIADSAENATMMASGEMFSADSPPYMVREFVIQQMIRLDDPSVADRGKWVERYIAALSSK